MPYIYATRDFDDGCAQSKAHIEMFRNEADARAWLLRDYDARDWAVETAVIAPVESWGDCWIKLYAEPRYGSVPPWPFTWHNQVSIKKPGEHPGGREYWVTPSASVTVLAIHDIRPRDTAE